MILLLDNYDSFVHNLARYFRLLGSDTRVIRSDEIDAAGCAALAPESIVISPGPRRPEQAGCSVSVVRALSPTTPILGVCLGHQAIGVAFGGVVRECGPVHGISSTIRHDAAGLFEGCSNPMVVGRYHSLAIDPQAMPPELRVTASTEDGMVMAVEHRARPLYGMQFHPESVLTDQGQKLLANFVDRARRFHTTHRQRETVS